MQGGYTQGSKELLDKTIQRGVKYAKELGMYAMIDWHIHAEDPNTTIADAKKFFRKYSKKYAQQIVKIIRANDPDAIIIVGTNTWSQGVDEANTWISFFEKNNISYTCWSLCNKNESASMISPTSSKINGWTNKDLGATGACEHVSKVWGSIREINLYQFK